MRVQPPPPLTGGWIGADVERGHRLRDTKSGAWPEPALQARAGVLVVGAGIAGLAAARALVAAGVDDVRVFDLEDTPGGNSRGHVMGGMACPLGAHYLPVPSERAVEVIALLDELGLRRVENGQTVYDERHLCHSPQERLFIAGHWHDGLLPPLEALPVEQRAATQMQYRQFAAAVEQVSAGGNAFTIPTARSAWSPALQELTRSRSRTGWMHSNSPRPRCAGTWTTAAATTTAPVPRRSRPGPGCTTSRAGTASMRRAMAAPTSATAY
jgi:phytoene dehydrogenase-like protein